MVKGAEPLLSRFLVRVTQVLIGRNYVPDPLFEFGDFGKTSFRFPGPDQCIVGDHLEYTTGTRTKRQLGDFLIEGHQQLLGHPGRAGQPAALRAKMDYDPVAHGESPPHAGRGEEPAA
jgi:hypothetical protein